jgi:hypothetical protein
MTVIVDYRTGGKNMSELTEIKHITLQDMLKESFSDQMVKKMMEIEKIRMQRTRAANIGVQKLFVETYNKTHNDSELKITDYGIIKVAKTV